MTDFEYIGGRPFTLGDMQVEPGQTIPQDYINLIPALESWISAGYIYRVVPDEGYGQLPPHVFNAVSTRREAEAALAGDPGVTNVVDAAQAQHEASDAVHLAEKQVEQGDEHARVVRRRRSAGLSEQEKADAVEATSRKGKKS